jgi:L-cysteine desulfidase
MFDQWEKNEIIAAIGVVIALLTLIWGIYTYLRRRKSVTTPIKNLNGVVNTGSMKGTSITISNSTRENDDRK